MKRIINGYAMLAACLSLLALMLTALGIAHAAECSTIDHEHGTLRADLCEPRIHFALVCASVGCPTLPNEAYWATDLNPQLDEQARSFLSDTSKNRFDPATNICTCCRFSTGSGPTSKWWVDPFPPMLLDIWTIRGSAEPV